MTISVQVAQTLLEDVQVESASLAASNAPQYLVPAFNSVNGTAASFANFLVSLPETGIAQEVFRAYEGVLGRAPSSSELQFYVNYAETGLNPSQIAVGPSAVSQTTWDTIFSGFYNSAELASRLGNGGPNALNNTQYVNFLYLDVLHRSTVTASEITFYVNQLNSGTSRVTVLESFINSSEYQNDVNGQISSSLVNAALNDTGSGPTYGEIAFGHSGSNAVAHSAVSAAALGLLHHA